MNYTYKKLAYIKIALWLIIMVTTMFTINVFSDEVIGIIFFLLWLFLLCWGSWYFVFRLIQYGLKQYHRYEHEKMIEAYKLSLLFSSYVLVNIILIIVEKRTRLAWINILIWFIILQILLVYDRNQDEW
jgi:hypothetical protein